MAASDDPKWINDRRQVKRDRRGPDRRSGADRRVEDRGREAGERRAEDDNRRGADRRSGTDRRNEAAWQPITLEVELTG